MDPQSSNARNIDDVEFEDDEVDTGHDDAEQYRKSDIRQQRYLRRSD